MSTFDLGAARRKRGVSPKELSLSDESGEIVFKAQIAAELPAEALDLGAAGQILGAFKALFLDPEDGEEFARVARPSIADFGSVIGGVYGHEAIAEALGEALASGSPSMSDGTA